MASGDLLVIALALPPMWLSATLWWSTRHALDELRESCALASPPVPRAGDPAVDRRLLAGPAPGSVASTVAGGTINE